MPKVTEVLPQKKNPRRFNVFLDGEFGFGADEDSVVNFRLIPGKVIPQEDLEKIIFETQVGKVLERIYGLFSVRTRSEREVRDYIRRKNFQNKVKEKEELSDLVVERLIEVLKQKGMINDLEFARAWVESRSRKLGPRLLQMELVKKGISREIIEEVTSNKGQGTREKEEETARKLLEKRWERIKNLPELEKKKKAYEFLLRRGFEYGLVRELVEKMLKS